MLVHPVQGKVRVLNPVGARVSELADGQRTWAISSGLSRRSTRWTLLVLRLKSLLFARIWRSVVSCRLSTDG